MSLVFKEPSADTNCFSDDDEDDIDDNRRGEINTIFFCFYMSLRVLVFIWNCMFM